jgi:TPR repeat protein
VANIATLKETFPAIAEHAKNGVLILSDAELNKVSGELHKQVVTTNGYLNLPALSILGFMFDHGQGVPADSQKALMYYSKAAKKGDENAKKNRDIIEARIAKQQSNH